jgi:DNA polymerase II small subunit
MSGELVNVISRALSQGYQVDPEALEVLAKLPQEVNLEELLQNVIQGKTGKNDRIVKKVDLERLLPTEGDQVPDFVQAGGAQSGNIEVLTDPTNEIAPIEAESGFKRLFQDRYWRLLGISRRRPDSKNVTTLEAAKTSNKEGLKIAGLLSSKTSRRGGVELVLDDPTGTARVQCDEELSDTAMRVPLDTLVVVGLSGGRGTQLYAKSVTLPDVPARKPVTASHRAYAVLLSDLHIGSETFLADDFRRFITWLNGGLGDSDILRHLKYVIIAGDVIDGVGVYPGQEYQLVEKDLRKQYELARQLLQGIPKGLKVLVAPGNHDPVRQALPQPAIPAEMAQWLYNTENIVSVGNPACVKLDGVNFLVYHGRSLDDIIATIPDLTYSKPAAAMKVLLKARHLAPMYGKRTPLSPEAKDMLVIDPVPDVFHCGHVHTIDLMEYRGTVLVNSGTFQAQTPFQANMGLEPVCSIVPILDLSSLEVTKRSFSKQGFGLGS